MWCGNSAFRPYQNHSVLPWCGSTEVFPLFIFLTFFFFTQVGGGDYRVQKGWWEWLQALCIESVEREEEGAEEGESEFVDTDTDGIVYLLWPRLDFQCLTCCNPHSVRSAPRVAQTSHWCFSRTAMLLPLSFPPHYTWQGEWSGSTVRCLRPGRGSKRQPRPLSNSLGPPHTDRLTLQGGFSRLIATTDFVILNLSHTDTLLKFKHMVFISNPHSV